MDAADHFIHVQVHVLSCLNHVRLQQTCFLNYVETSEIFKMQMIPKGSVVICHEDDEEDVREGRAAQAISIHLCSCVCANICLMSVRACVYVCMYVRVGVCVPACACLGLSHFVCVLFV